MNAELWIAAASFVVAASAFWLSWQSEARSQLAARTQLYLDLRTRFLHVLEGLPAKHTEPDWDASSKEDHAAAVRYWHHSFDEWYLTRWQNQKLMGTLWDEFYSKALLSGLKHNGLRKALATFQPAEKGPTELWVHFTNELEAIWKKEHPNDGTRCSGIECAHKPR